MNILKHRIWNYVVIIFYDFCWSGLIITIKEDEGFYEYLNGLGHRFLGLVDEMNSIVLDAQMLLPDSNIIFHEAGIIQHNDLGNITLPGANCLISTMAAQISINDHFEMYIDERLFNHVKHSRQSKATLILHELLYAYGRRLYEHKDSTATRKLVRQYISYHSSVTEGSSSVMLLNLNFTHPMSDYKVKNALGNSKIMQVLEWEMQSYYSWARVFYDYSMILIGTSSNLEFYENVESELKKIYPENVFNGPAGYRKLRLMIQKGLELSAHQQWKEFEAQFKTIAKNQKAYLLKELKLLNDDVLKKLTLYTHANQKQLDLITKFLAGWFEDFDSMTKFQTDEEREHFLFVEMAEQSATLLKQTYNINITSECRSDIPTDFPDPSDTDGNKSLNGKTNCYGPLFLDNIIPKTYIQKP